MEYAQKCYDRLVKEKEEHKLAEECEKLVATTAPLHRFVNLHYL